MILAMVDMLETYFEQAKMNQASRLLEMDFNEITLDEISMIKAVDIMAPELQAPQKRKIGFAC